MVNNVFSNDYNLRLRKWFFIFYFTLNTISFISFLLIRLIQKARSRNIIIKMWPNMCYSNGKFLFLCIANWHEISPVITNTCTIFLHHKLWWYTTLLLLSILHPLISCKIYFSSTRLQKHNNQISPRLLIKLPKNGCWTLWFAKVWRNLISNLWFKRQPT